MDIPSPRINDIYLELMKSPRFSTIKNVRIFAERLSRYPFDVKREILKSDMWASVHPPKKYWDRFIINWLNRVKG